MAVQLFTNNASSTLAANLAIAATSIDVAVGEGALFPTLSGGDWFYATIESGANREIVKVTARTSDTLTIERAQEGTSDQSWTLGDTIEVRITNAWLSSVHTEDSLPAASIGDVVGPASSTDSGVVLYDGTTGKLLKDSGLLLSGTNTGDQTISDATITTTDITTNDFTTSKHGFCPKGTNVGKFLKDDGSWAVPAPVGALPECIINGLMQLWQRGTSFATVATGAYTADQWKIDYVTSGVLTLARQALGDATIQTATGQRVPYALRHTVTTADVSIAAGDYHVLTQNIEGYRALPYLHNQFTVSFYVRSNVTGTYCFSVRNVGTPPADRSYLKTFTVDVADTWERKTITVPTQDATGTWNYGTGIGLRLGISLMSGTTFEGTDDTWQSGDLLNVSGGSNFLAATSQTFDLTAVQLDLGPAALPFRGLPLAEDLALAERYFQKSYDVNVDPAAVSALGQVAFTANGTGHIQPVALRTPMRAAPTVALYNPTDGASDWEHVGTGPITVASSNEGMHGFTVTCTSSVDLATMNGHWTAKSEF